MPGTAQTFPDGVGDGTIQLDNFVLEVVDDDEAFVVLELDVTFVDVTTFVLLELGEDVVIEVDGEGH